MLRNNPIRNKTDTIGFLLMITKIPQRIADKEIQFKNMSLNPLVKLSFKINKVKIFKNKFTFSKVKLLLIFWGLI